MNASDKLYPFDIKSQCDSAIAILTQDNADIGNVRKNLENFITDDELVSKTYSTLKLQISDYLSVLSAMTAANDMDIADLQTLKASVGSEELLGEVILSCKEAAKNEENQYKRMADMYYKKAGREPWGSPAGPLYTSYAFYYEGRAFLAKSRYDRWVAKEHKFDKINFTTKKLFTHSQTFRKAAKDGLAAVKKAFQNGKYIIDENAEWRTAIYAENNRRIEQIKSGFMTENEEGTLVYDWKKIEEWLKKDADEVTDLEYLAFVDVMSGMSNEDLERLFSKMQLQPGGSYETSCLVSGAMEEAARRYLYIAQMEAGLTIFDEHSKYAYDEADVTNELSKAFLIYQVMDSMKVGAGKKHNVSITSKEDANGKLTYVANMTVFPDLAGTDSKEILGEIVLADTEGRVITVNPWGSNTLAQGNLEDCVKATLFSLDSSVGGVLLETAGWEAAGFVLEKIGETVGGDIGGILSFPVSLVGLGSDLKESCGNSVAIEGAVNILDTSHAVDALGIRMGVVSVTGYGLNEAIYICPRYDEEELYVRVEAYNSVHTEASITVEDVKSAFTNGGEDLKKYVDWYYEEEGDEDITAYWRELTDIVIEYKGQNPELVIGDPDKMNLEQLQELINKKNDPTYEINMEVMK